MGKLKIKRTPSRGNVSTTNNLKPGIWFRNGPWSSALYRVALVTDAGVTFVRRDGRIVSRDNTWIAGDAKWTEAKRGETFKVTAP